MALPSILSYEHLSYEIKLENSEMRRLVDDVSVQVKAGEVLAILGPSGAGKSTLLELMSFRRASLSGSCTLFNGRAISQRTMHKISAFVEQDDALYGALTVRESVEYSLRLHSPFMKRRDAAGRVNSVITALGLTSCAEQKIGTALSRGISNGQKRRVAAACAMVTYPRILFLDEVTSGLDSTAAREVIASIKSLAIAEGMIVLAAIHQPSMDTLTHFTNILLLSGGRMCYAGPVADLEAFFEKWGHPVPRNSTPPEHALNFLNNDFEYADEAKPIADAQDMQDFYLNSWRTPPNTSSQSEAGADGEETFRDRDLRPAGAMFWNALVLSERSAKNYVRNLLSYPMRAGIYAGSGLLVATIWIRLDPVDSTISDRLALHFYTVVYLAVSSVAVVPSFLEERAVYYRETKNGFYTTMPFMVSNVLVNIPFLFGCTTVYNLITYWAVGLHPGATAFFRYLGFLFLVIFVSESQILAIASLVPHLVPALCLSAFISGFWLSLSGFFIKSRSLPKFWHNSFHYADYMKYAFEILTNADLRGLNFRCQQQANGPCLCAYPSSTPEMCMVSGEDVLDYVQIGTISYKKWAGFLIVIMVLCRIIMYLALKGRSK